MSTPSINIVLVHGAFSAQGPIAPAEFGDKMGPPAWKQHKSWYQVSENDEMTAPDAQRWMARRAAAATISIPSSHASLRAHPRAIAELILGACAGATITADAERLAV
jgi:hypothetical protein